MHKIHKLYINIFISVIYLDIHIKINNYNYLLLILKYYQFFYYINIYLKYLFTLYYEYYHIKKTLINNYI